MKSRLWHLVSQDGTLVVLAQIAIAALLLTVIAGTIALIWDRQAFGNMVGTAADVCAWTFAATFLIAFAIATAREHQQKEKG